MRRFVTLLVLLLFSIPFGVSITGCTENAAPTFCNGGDSGITTGQVTTISLTPIVYGISLNYAEIGQISPPTATDCTGRERIGGKLHLWHHRHDHRGRAAVVGRSMQRGPGTATSGGGIPDYTYCIPATQSGNGVHLGQRKRRDQQSSADLHTPGSNQHRSRRLPRRTVRTDPTTACCPLAAAGAVTAPLYLANSCLSQGSTAQLVARIFAGTGSSQTNISCFTGHLQYSVQGSTSTTNVSPVVSIDENGVATANQPGSVLITANVADASSSAGFISTCPPTSITLATPGTTTNPVIVNEKQSAGAFGNSRRQEWREPHRPIAGICVHLKPTTIPASSTGSITPVLAGSASISAICQPPSCNPASFNQIGLFGNGKPITSNSVSIATPGTNGTVLYMASTQSLYMEAKDFTQPGAAAPFQLPFLPNSMVLSNDGSTLYMGSSTALMVVNAVNTLSLTRTDIGSPGVVLAVSPDGGQIVLSDPVKQITTILTSSGSVISTYGGYATHAEFTPVNQTMVTSPRAISCWSTRTTPAGRPFLQPHRGEPR